MQAKRDHKRVPTPRVLYVQYTNPAVYPPLEHSSHLLAKAGWQVLFLGTGALGAGALRFLPHDRITVRQMPFCPAGWQQKLHYLRFCFWVLWWTICWRPRWVYASDPLSCPIVILLSFLLGVRVIYHEHDSPAATSNSPFIRLCLAARRSLARRAEMCILPNQRRAEAFAQEMAKGPNIFCVWNCPTQEEIASPRQSHNGNELWVLYHGSIVPIRLPPTVLHALTKLPASVQLRVIGYETVGHRGYVRHLQETASQLGLGERVQFLGAMPRGELLAWCHRCDVGLAFMPKDSDDINEQAMTGASNKPFDYLACGLALLVTDLPDWRKMYVESDYALVCDPDDPESIAVALRWFLDHPDAMHKMGEQGRQRIAAEWNYETQFALVWQRMHEQMP